MRLGDFVILFWFAFWFTSKLALLLQANGLLGFESVCRMCMKSISELRSFCKTNHSAKGRLLKVCESEIIVMCWSVKFFLVPPPPLENLSSVENEETAKLTTGEGIRVPSKGSWQLRLLNFLQLLHNVAENKACSKETRMDGPFSVII